MTQGKQNKLFLIIGTRPVRENLRINEVCLDEFMIERGNRYRISKIYLKHMINMRMEREWVQKDTGVFSVIHKFV